jgi:hypothetical protein
MIMDPVNSRTAGGGSSRLIEVGSELKTCGLRLASATWSYRVSA